jgi:F420-dependent oxidoreductase-like protein
LSLAAVPVWLEVLSVRLGLYCNHFNWPGGESVIRPGLSDLAREAEAAGFSSFWLMDHFFQLPRHGNIDDPMLEAYSTLGFIAAITKTMQLGTMVTGITYRHPGVLVKAVTTLDVLSGGRAALGIGAAWFGQEHDGLGIPFPPLATRFEMLEEALQIAHQMWRDDRAPHNGKNFQLAEPISRPRSIQQPHPPIVVGGRGERKTLRLVAHYGDACNFSMFHHGPDLSSPEAMAEVRQKLEVLRGHCEALGRPHDEIERTVLGWLPISLEPHPGSFTPGAAVEVCRQYAELGFDHLMIATSTLFPEGTDSAIMAAFRGEIIPAVAAIVPAGRAG